MNIFSAKRIRARDVMIHTPAVSGYYINIECRRAKLCVHERRRGFCRDLLSNRVFEMSSSRRLTDGYRKDFAVIFSSKTPVSQEITQKLG